MTLNQVIKRIEALALSHRQINHFFIGNVDEFTDDQDVQYPAIFCEIKPGTISRAQRLTTFNFTFYFLDLLSISSEALVNEWEVKSDMVSVAEDFLAMLYDPELQDTWDISTTNAIEFFDFKLHDLCAGISCSISISVRYNSNRCQVPATGVSFPTNDTTMIVQNLVYTGIGTEGNIMTFGTLVNKKILMCFKGDKLLNPQLSAVGLTANDFYFDAATGQTTFGNEIENEQIIQILWRSL